MFDLNPSELIIILVIAVIIFGPSRLPELGEAIGKGLNKFKSDAKDFKDTIKEVEEEKKEKRTEIKLLVLKFI